MKAVPRASGSRAVRLERPALAGDQMRPPCAFDDAARERQREAHAAALVVEWYRLARRMRLVRPLLRRRSRPPSGRPSSWTSRRSATTGAWARLFAQDRAKNRVECRFRSRVVVAGDGWPRPVPRELRDARRDPLPHAHLGHLGQEREQVGRLLSAIMIVAVVELADSLSSAIERDQPRARFLRLVDHLPLPLAQRRSVSRCSIRR